MVFLEDAEPLADHPVVVSSPVAEVDLLAAVVLPRKHEHENYASFQLPTLPLRLTALAMCTVPSLSALV